MSDDEENLPPEEPEEMTMRPEYREEEAEVAQARFTKFVGYVLGGHTLGLLGSIWVWQQFADRDGVQGVMLASGMIYAIGLATTTGSYIIFQTAIAMSREAVKMRKQAGGDEMRLSMAREQQADAVERAKNGFKPLNFAGVCLVASTLLAVSGLLSL